MSVEESLQKPLRSGFTAKNQHEYNCWRCMKRRVFNPNEVSYKYAGALGCTLYEPWLDFRAFLNDMGPSPTPKHSIDRFPDRKGNYEPGNVRWANKTEQVENRSISRLLAFRGETRCVTAWSRIVGIATSTILSRINDWGWTVEEAMTVRPFSGRGSYAS